MPTENIPEAPEMPPHSGHAAAVSTVSTLEGFHTMLPYSSSVEITLNSLLILVPLGSGPLLPSWLLLLYHVWDVSGWSTYTSDSARRVYCIPDFHKYDEKEMLNTVMLNTASQSGYSLIASSPGPVLKIWKTLTSTSSWCCGWGFGTRLIVLYPDLMHPPTRKGSGHVCVALS